MKTALGQLSALGGPAPLFAEPLHVGRPNQGSRARLSDRIAGLLDRNWLTNDGPLVREFEASVAALLHVPEVIAVCNGTLALEIAIRGLNLTGEVIVPSLTFIATAHALQWLGLTPVFCDTIPGSSLIDPDCAESLVGPDTTAILAVHTWGLPADVGALEDVAQRHDLALLFDAAHAFGNTHMGTRIGGFGRAEVFSFHATKFLNTFEGGAITTTDHDLAEKLRRMRNFGFAGYDEVQDLGTNGKLTEVCAAQGLTNLEALDDFVATNAMNYAHYQRTLKGVPGLRLIDYPSHEWSNKQYVVTTLIEEEYGVSRDRVVDVLWAENVLARRYFYPGCHRMEPYRSTMPLAGRSLPETERLLKQLLVLPTGGHVGEQDIESIGGLMRLIHENAHQLR